MLRRHKKSTTPLSVCFIGFICVLTRISATCIPYNLVDNMSALVQVVASMASQDSHLPENALDISSVMVGNKDI